MGIGSDATNACAGAEFVDGDEQVWASQMFVNTWQPEWIFSILELRGFFPRNASEQSCNQNGLLPFLSSVDSFHLTLPNKAVHCIGTALLVGCAPIAYCAVQQHSAMQDDIIELRYDFQTKNKHLTEELCWLCADRK